MKNIFKKFQSKKQEERKEEEYEVATFSRCKFPMTDELLRRQRADEIKKKYCKS